MWKEEPTMTYATSPQAQSGPPKTVKQARLFGGTDDTFRTEAEFNGYRATQGALDMTAGTVSRPTANTTGPLL